MDKLQLAEMDDWIVSGASALPRAKTLSQRERYFGNVEFSGLREVLERAEGVEFL